VPITETYPIGNFSFFTKTHLLTFIGFYSHDTSRKFSQAAQLIFRPRWNGLDDTAVYNYDWSYRLVKTVGKCHVIQNDLSPVKL
jgi:hypothetical protein